MRDLEGENAGLNGDYTLRDPTQETDDEKPDDVCQDGCVYTKGGEDYCFREVPIADAPIVECEVNNI